MPYEIKYHCLACGAAVTDRDKHDDECPEGPKKVAEYEAWDKSYQANKALWDAWAAHRKEMGKPELKSIESVEFGPDEVAVKGWVVLMSDQSDFGGGRDWYSKPIENPTWGQVLVALSKSIKTTKDTHHVFMEGVSETGKTLSGVLVYRIDTGS
jgi:hypothetical protein